MSRIEEILNIIDLKTFTDALSKLDINDPSYKKTYAGLLNAFSSKVINVLDKESIEIRVSVLDMFFNISPAFTMNLVSKGNENIIKAQLVLENIKSIKPSDIKDNVDVARAAYSMYAMNNGLFSDKSSSITTYGYEMCKYLSNYLSKMNNDEINDMVEEDTLEFYKKLENVDGMIFSALDNSNVPLRSQFISKLFKLQNIDNETLSYIFNNVLEKNILLESFDYSSILENDPTLIQRVKGMYKKCNAEFFDLLLNDDFYHDADEIEEAIEFFGDICSLNEDDEVGLKTFFKEIYLRADRCPNLIKHLEEEDFYQKYAIHGLDEKYENAVKQILSGDYKIDEFLIQGLGKSKAFVSNFDKILDSFEKSGDSEYQRALIIPLTVALAEIQ